MSIVKEDKMKKEEQMKMYRIRRETDGAILMISNRAGHYTAFGIKGTELHLNQPTAEIFTRHAKMPIVIEEIGGEE